MGDSENVSTVEEHHVMNTKFIHSLLKGVRNVFLLWLLSKNKMHGYAIVSKINETYKYTGEKVVHGSTIYPLLHSLEKQGLIESSEEYNGNKKIKIYETTEKGIDTLNSLKQFIKSRPENDLFTTYLDEMIFNNEMFVYEGE